MNAKQGGFYPLANAATVVTNVGANLEQLVLRRQKMQLLMRNLWIQMH